MGKDVVTGTSASAVGINGKLSSGPADLDQGTFEGRTVAGSNDADHVKAADGAIAGVDAGLAIAWMKGLGIRIDEFAGGDASQWVDFAGAIGGGKSPEDDRGTVFQGQRIKAGILPLQNIHARDLAVGGDKPIRFLCDFGEYPIVLAAAEQSFAVGAVG